MGWNYTSLVGGQVRFLVSNLTKKNFKASVAEVHSLIDLYGAEVQACLLRTLVEAVGFSEGGKGQKDATKVQLLCQEIATLSEKPNSASLICFMLSGAEKVTEEFLQHFVKVLKLSFAHQLCIALGISNSAKESERIEGIKFLKSTLSEFTKSVNNSSSVPAGTLQSLVHFLYQEESFSSEKETVFSHLKSLDPKGVESFKNLQEELDLKFDSCKDVNSKRNYNEEMTRPGDHDVTGFLSTVSSSIQLHGVMQDIGYSCTSSPGSLKELFAMFPEPVNENDIAKAIGMMAATASGLQGRMSGYAQQEKELTTWNVNLFVDVLKEVSPRLLWWKVAQALDYPGFDPRNRDGLSVIVKAYQRGAKEAFPSEAVVCKRWNNPDAQVNFLKVAVTNPDLINFANTPNRQAPYEKPANQHHQQPHPMWLSLDLLRCLLELGNGEHYETCRNLLQPMARTQPELLLLGVAQVKLEWTQLQSELVAETMAPFLSGSMPNPAPLFFKLWEFQRELVLRGMVDVYMRDPLALSRILMVTQELKALPIVLEARPFLFAMDLAALASWREYLNLEKWLKNKIMAHKDQFVKAAIQLLVERIPLAYHKEDKMKHHAIQITPEVISVFMKCLTESASDMARDTQEDIKRLYALWHSKAFPDSGVAVSLGAGDGGGEGDQAVEGSFSADIEEEANGYFQKVYTGQQSIDNVINMLKNFKNSQSKREKDIYNCMIHNLFDEYRFFAKYPDNELMITGILFGSLIHHELVTSITLGMALRYVLEALRSAPGSKMFKFGLYALERFRPRLPEWPQYCNQIVQIQHLQESVPEVVKYVKNLISRSANEGMGGGQSSDVPSRPPPGTLSAPSQQPQEETSQKPSPAVGSSMSFATLNIDTLMGQAGTVKPIDTASQDRIHFIFNNVAPSSVEQKAKDLARFLKPEHYPYVSHYLVVKRASLEINHHEMYLQFIDLLNAPGLHQQILSTTYENVNVLLDSSKIKTHSSERSLLKNLGSWLGKLTICRNRPVLQKFLDVKKLLIDACERGRLIAVVSFVAKILENCASSKVFRPPNPWLMAMLALLAEIYQIPDLKLNIKFEIEVLCKALNVGLTDITPTKLLESRKIEKEDNPDFANRAAAQPSGGDGALFGQSPAPSPNASVPSSPAQAAEDADLDKQHGMSFSLPPPSIQQQPGQPFAQGQNEPTIVSNLASFVRINDALQLFTQQPHLKRVVVVAIDRAIREIITPVVERSVTISCITTRELILKDFAMEPDETKMRKSAHQMIQTLAGNLALVTCKEPLRVSMGNHLRSLLSPTTSDANVIEQVVQTISTDNLELCYQLIEKAATDKATRDIDEQLAPALTIRRKHRESTGQPYLDMSIFSAGRYPRDLPEPLRPKPGGLAMRPVYEDFTRVRHGINTAEGVAMAAAAEPVTSQVIPTSGAEKSADFRTALSGVLAGRTDQPSDAAQQQQWPGEKMSTHQALEKLSGLIGKFEVAAQRGPDATLAQFAPDHEIHQAIRQVVVLIANCANPEETAGAFTVVLFNRPLSSEHKFMRETAAAMLGNICEKSKKATTFATEHVVEGDIKFQVDTMALLLRYRVVSASDYSSYLAKVMDQGRNAKAVEFATVFVRKCLIDEQVVQMQDVTELISVLHKVAQHRGKGGEGLLKLLEDARVATSSKGSKDQMKSLKASGEKTPEEAERQRIAYIFQEWIHICREPMSEKVVGAYFGSLHQQGWLKGDESTERFFRVLTTLCIETVLESEQQQIAAGTQPPAMNYAALDGFSKLVVFLVKLHGEQLTPDMKPPGSNSMAQKVQLLNKILTIIVGIVVSHHNQKAAKFNQKPYFRLFVNLLNDFNSPDPNLDSNNFQVLSAFTMAFHSMQPLRIPAFAFAWLELISHRMFMPKLLMGKKGWQHYQSLLVDMLKFLEPYLRTATLTNSTRLLYRGLLRVLLLLLHDFPEFLCDYHFSFCDVIPPSCIQMRNLILSAFPRNMRLPDPFTPNLKVDLLPEISQSPRVLSNYAQALSYNNLKTDLDQYMKSRSPVSFLLELKNKVMLPEDEALVAGTKYNVPVMNSLVMYVGTQAIAQLQQQKSPAASPITYSAPIDILHQLAMDLESDGRYLFLNAIANQLRYPNNHTHYFSCVLLYLFAEAKQEMIQEQITRVLLERLIVHRPHPWGLLITFIELIKNPRYSFWNYPFVRCAPEVERLFEHVARSCMGSMVPPGKEREEGQAQTKESS